MLIFAGIAYERVGRQVPARVPTDGVSRPRVSVLLPVRDEEPFLAECLESLSAQTLPDFEVIAVDDGSTDAHGGDPRGARARATPASASCARSRPGWSPPPSGRGRRRGRR